MVKIFCDRCKKDCKLNAYDIMVNVLHNPTPHSVRDIGEPCITQDNIHIRFTLCGDCYEKMGLPNVYSVERKGLVFENADDPKEDDPAEPEKEICKNCCLWKQGRCQKFSLRTNWNYKCMGGDFVSKKENNK